MIDQQPKLGDRVRIAFEATVGSVEPGRVIVTMPGDEQFAQRFMVVPAHATVEVLRPPTLAERMAALADELELARGFGGHTASRIREVLAAHQSEEAQRD